MRTVSFALACSMLMAACNNSESQPSVPPKDSIVQMPADTSVQPYMPHPAPRVKEMTRLDSIEMENNKSVLASGDDITKAYFPLNSGDSTMYLTAYMRKDHRFFGYAHPDIHSDRLILFSIFTNDVQDNPFKCRYGAYYQIVPSDSLHIKYLSADSNFVRTELTHKTERPVIVYFEKKWINFE